MTAAGEMGVFWICGGGGSTSELEQINMESQEERFGRVAVTDFF